MADETNTTTNGTAPQTHQAQPIMGNTVPSFRLSEEVNKRQEATRARDAALSELQELRAKFEGMSKEIEGVKTGHSQELHLMERGFVAPSVRRFFRREYTQAVADIETGKRPGFKDWLDANSDDPLYSVHFERLRGAVPSAQEQTPQGAAPPVDDNQKMLEALRAALTGNPTAGASQPAGGHTQEWTADEIRKLRAKNKNGSQAGTLGGRKDEILAQWRAKGIIK